MSNETRQLFNAYLNDVAALNKVDASTVTAGHKFSVDPEIEIAMQEIIAEETGFLGRISMSLEDAQQGKVAGMEMGDPISSTTDTSGDGERQAVDPQNTRMLNEFFCKQINFDTAIRYELMDKWRHRPEFAALYGSLLGRRRGRDNIMIGWNGTHRAAKSDRTANPDLKDVAKGFLQKLREHNNGSQVLFEGRQDAGEIRIGYKVNVGEGTEIKGDFANIDAAVLDLVDGKIAEWYQDDTDMVVIVGRHLMHDKHFTLAQNNLPASEQKAALDIILGNKTIAGMRAMRVPFFPARGLLITPLDNLDLTAQKDTTRRNIIDNPKKDQVEDYQSQNMDWCIRDYTRITYMEAANVKLLNELTGEWE